MILNLVEKEQEVFTAILYDGTNTKEVCEFGGNTQMYAFPDGKLQYKKDTSWGEWYLHEVKVGTYFIYYGNGVYDTFTPEQLENSFFVLDECSNDSSDEN